MRLMQISTLMLTSPGARMRAKLIGAVALAAVNMASSTVVESPRRRDRWVGEHEFSEVAEASDVALPVVEEA